MSLSAKTTNINIKEMKSVLKQHGYFNADKLCNTLQGSIWSSNKPDTDKESVIIKVTNKKLHKQGVVTIDGKRYSVQENVLKERAILKYLTTQKKSPSGIVKYIDWFYDEENYYMVMEHGGNSMFDFITKVHKYILMGKIELSEWQKLVQLLFKQMVNTIDYMHKHNVANFDISLENMLINDIDVAINGNDDKLKFIMDDPQNPITMKMCDLGLAEIFNNNTFKSSKYAGKSNYKSPEIIGHKKSFDASSNDIFCLGVCLFMMIVGGAPFGKAKENDIHFNLIINGGIMTIIQHWDRSSYVTPEIIDLLSLIFKYEQDRISMAELKQHPYLN